MVCDNCGNPTANRMKFGNAWCGCEKCMGFSTTTIHDVYFRSPYLDPNLVDPSKPEQKNGVWIESKGHKAAIMKQLGVRECGDKQHGCRIEDKAAIRRETERLK